jgi:hypothetical protein
LNDITGASTTEKIESLKALTSQYDKLKIEFQNRFVADEDNDDHRLDDLINKLDKDFLDYQTTIGNIFDGYDPDADGSIEDQATAVTKTAVDLKQMGEEFKHYGELALQTAVTAAQQAVTDCGDSVEACDAASLAWANAQKALIDKQAQNVDLWAGLDVDGDDNTQLDEYIEKLHADLVAKQGELQAQLDILNGIEEKFDDYDSDTVVSIEVQAAAVTKTAVDYKQMVEEFKHYGEPALQTAVTAAQQAVTDCGDSVEACDAAAMALEAAKEALNDKQAQNFMLWAGLDVDGDGNMQLDEYIEKMLGDLETSIFKDDYAEMKILYEDHIAACTSYD